VTIGPDDLPPPDGGRRQLYCSCTNDTYRCVFTAEGAALICTSCRKVPAVFPLAAGDLTGDRDTLPAPGSTMASPAVVKTRVVQGAGAFMRGGDLDGKYIPVIMPDVNEFVDGIPGGGFAAMGSGAAWGEAMHTGGVYRWDGHSRNSDGFRIFDLAGPDAGGLSKAEADRAMAYGVCTNDQKPLDVRTVSTGDGVLAVRYCPVCGLVQ